MMNAASHHSSSAVVRRMLALAAATVLSAGQALAAGVPATAPVPAARASANPAAAEADAELYRIGPGDTIRITVYQSPDLSIETRVTEAGVISYPLLGRVVLGGLTVNAAESKLAQLLRKGEIVKDPQVMIVVTQVRANQVNVLGQVARPGRFPLDVAGMKLTEVLALAGGIVAGAGSDTIVIQGTREGRPFRREIDLPHIFTAAGQADDIVVGPGDTIWVDRAPQIYLYGEIQHPGTQRLERGMTVMQAVAAAGGATQRGTLKGLRISRRGADGKLATFEPSMEDQLKDGDVVFIRESLF